MVMIPASYDTSQVSLFDQRSQLSSERHSFFIRVLFFEKPRLDKLLINLINAHQSMSC